MLFESIAVLASCAGFILSVYKKELTLCKVHPWFTTSIPNIVGHPMLFVMVALFLGISFPKHPAFYWSFAAVGVLTLIAFYFKLHGYTASLFSGCSVIGTTSVIFTAIGAVIFLNEHLSLGKWLAVLSTFLGLIIITWPERSEHGTLHFDKGLFMVLLSVFIGVISGIFYRYSATLVPDYASFLVGRLTVDYLVYGTSLTLVLPQINGKSFSQNFKHFLHQKNSIKYVSLAIMLTLIGSYLFFVLPLTKLTMIGTLVTPLSFLIGHLRYHEHPRWRTYLGGLAVFASVLWFVLI